MRVPRKYAPEDKLINQKALKEANLRRILEFVKAKKETIKSEVSRELHLSFSTVSNLSSLLESHSLIMTEESDVSSGGRKPARILFNPDARYMISVDMSLDSEVSISLMNLNYTVVGRKILTRTYGELLDALLQLIADSCSELQAACGAAPPDIIGVTVAVPGVFDRTRQIMIASTDPMLLHVKLKERFERMLPYPVWIENDSNMAALGEVITAEHRMVNLLFLYFSKGIGLGIVTNRSIYLGSTGYAGEFGHMKVTDRAIRCECGQEGCLESVISLPRMIHSVYPGRYSDDEISRDKDVLIQRIISESLEGSSTASSAIREYEEILGNSIGFLVDLLNPDAVALGGDMKQLLDHVFPRMVVHAKKRSTVLRETDAHVYIADDVRTLIAKGCGETAFSHWLGSIKLLALRRG